MGELLGLEVDTSDETLDGWVFLKTFEAAFIRGTPLHGNAFLMMSSN